MSRRVFPAVLLLAFVAALVGLSWPREPDLAAEAREDLAKRGFAPLSGPVAALVEDATYDPVPTQVHPLLNAPAPPFELRDVDGRRRSLKEFLADGPVVLVFYYGYNCNHCVSQLFGLSKDADKFRELGARVVAVSADPAEFTRKRYDRYGAFAFPVLSDPTNAVAEAYGAYLRKPDGEGEPTHATFVISPAGRVVWANRGEEPFTQNRTLLVEVHRLGRAK